MSPQQLLLLLNFARTIIIVIGLWWVIFTPMRAAQMKKIILPVLFAILAINIYASGISMFILKVKVW